MSKAADKYTVKATFKGVGGEPVAGLAVTAFDQDRGRNADRIGSATTSNDGGVAFTFDQAAVGGRTEGRPEVFLQVRRPDGSLALQTRTESVPPGDSDLGVFVVHASVGIGTGVTASVPSGAPAANDASSPAGENRFHGSRRRDAVVPRSPFYHGPFGRIFRQLPPWTPPGADDAAKEGAIRAIAATMVEQAGAIDPTEGDNPSLPVGYTYFGQFVDHDITFDPTSSLARLNDPDRLVNFRTPRFDLDNLYGEGPDDEPFMYDQTPGHRGEFLIGSVSGGPERDLPRNEQGTALIGDPRNDENLIVSQLQLAFMTLHNAVLKRVVAEEGLTGRDAFTRAQNLVRWHYQWVVLFDFLPRICGAETLAKVFSRDPITGALRFDLRFYKFRDAPYMPVEFSAAAYRYGHSQIRERYDLNSSITGIPIFVPPDTNPSALADLRGFRRLPSMWSVDWRRFLEIDPARTPQRSRRIDARLSHALSSIPAGPDPAHGASLAALNLLRGFRLGLPSGQAVARAMGEEVLGNDALELPDDAGSEAPLWYYVLKEADFAAHGEHLGPVGGRIVAETFVGLAKADPSCFLTVDPGWTPAKAFTNGVPLDEQKDAIKLAGLIRAAGRAGNPLPFGN